jgi:hypothetical protein
MRKPSSASEWERHAPDMLARFKRGYDAGVECAFWDAVLFCEQTDTPKPTWLREALEQYAKDRINGRTPKKKAGRPRDLSRDTDIFALVNYWREQQIIFGRGRKPRRFSLDRSFLMVQKQLKKEGKTLSIGAIRAAFERGSKVLAKPDLYRLSPFLE